MALVPYPNWVFMRALQRLEKGCASRGGGGRGGYEKLDNMMFNTYRKVRTNRGHKLTVYEGIGEPKGAPAAARECPRGPNSKASATS